MSTTRTDSPDNIDQATQANSTAKSILEAKLNPPRQRRGIVARTDLVRRMLDHDDGQLISMVAPPGYGKTTVLAQWSSQQSNAAAWLSMDATDNDPSMLLASAAMALGRAGADADADAVSVVASRSVSVPVALTRLVTSLPPDHSVTLVLDHLEAVSETESLDVIGELAWRLPVGSHVALASRSPLPIAVPVLRSRGMLLEVGPEDLAMNVVEAHELLVACGVTLAPEQVALVVEQTEGWPAGIYLAGLALIGHGRAIDEGFAFSGDDVHMADYLRTEVLARLSDSTVAFLRRTAILEHLSAPLCDAVVGGTGSQDSLEALEASNLLIVPLDRRRQWYRYHRLLRELLLSELQRREPDQIPVLHRRASAWFEAHQMPHAAITHAQMADDTDRVARLVAINVQTTFGAGRATVARQWCEWFRTEGLLDDYPQIAVLGAWVESLWGQAASADQWTALAEASTASGVLPDGSPVEAWRAYLRALRCRNGMAQMREDAQTALSLLTPMNTMRAGLRFFEGLSYYAEGDPDTAEAILAEACEIADLFGAMPASMSSLAVRSLIAVEAGRWDDAKRLIDLALQRIEEYRLAEYGGAGFAFAVAARICCHRGDAESARQLIAGANRLRPGYNHSVPIMAIAQLELAKAYAALGDPRSARSVLHDMDEIVRYCPDLGVVPQQAKRMLDTLASGGQRTAGVTSLTAAELRLVPYLVTHLSFREIAERLYVSRYTVKTQALAIYRKVGVNSRSEAIEALRTLGMLAS